MAEIAFIMGCANAGKSAFIQYAIRASTHVRAVEVGKLLRAKYPPSHFKGQGNPSHTAAEAWQLLDSTLKTYMAEDQCQVILVDGQPRDFEQVNKCVCSWPGIKRRFVLLDCYMAERESRAEKRFDPTEPDYREKYDLAIARIRNDMVMYYVVLAELLKMRVPVEVVDTNRPREEYEQQLLSSLLSGEPYA